MNSAVGWGYRRKKQEAKNLLQENIKLKEENRELSRLIDSQQSHIEYLASLLQLYEEDYL